MEDFAKILRDVVGKTIGMDLVGTVPDEKPAKIKWSDNPDLLDSPHEEPAYLKGYREYKPTEEDIELIKSHGFEYDRYDYATNDAGDILVRTKSESWMALAGREWLIDRKTGEKKLVRMS